MFTNKISGYLLAIILFAGTTPLAFAQVPAPQETVVKPSGISHEVFSEGRFKELQAANQYILVDIFADWCPTCAKQQKVLDEYAASFPDAPLTILQIDFDKQKEWVTHFKAPRQSTMILYKGQEQLWFSVAQTKKNKIFEALEPVTVPETPGTAGNK